LTFARNEHAELQYGGLNRADRVVEAEADSRRIAEQKWEIAWQGLSIAPLPRMPGKAGERDGMRNEVEHPMAEDHSSNDDPGAVITVDAFGQ